MCDIMSGCRCSRSNTLEWCKRSTKVCLAITYIVFHAPTFTYMLLNLWRKITKIISMISLLPNREYHVETRKVDNLWNTIWKDIMRHAKNISAWPPHEIWQLTSPCSKYSHSLQLKARNGITQHQVQKVRTKNEFWGNNKNSLFRPL